MNKIQINILTNYKGEFYSSLKMLRINRLSMDINFIKELGEQNNIDFKFINFSDISFNSNYKNQYFLYTSSEDTDLKYKGYIEDVILGLHYQGAILIPDFKYFRAHHNKVFMEILRDIVLGNNETGIKSNYYGAFEDIKSKLENINLPAVIKNAEGAGSKGVVLVKEKNDLVKTIKRISKSYRFNEIIKKYTRKYYPFSFYRNKFVVQNFIPNLSGDYKVLIFGEKYYIISRENRKNDFRASGSGLLNFNPIIPEGIFDFAEKVFIKLNVPTASLDIAYDGYKFYLIEFQCLHFGTVTLEKSIQYFIKNNNRWEKIETSSILEEEFVKSVQKFLNEKCVKK